MRASASASAATVTAVASHLSWIAHPGAAALSGLCTVKQTPMIATAGSDGTLRLWTLSHIQVSALLSVIRICRITDILMKLHKVRYCSGQ
jgi:hypothetical protein